MPSPGRSSACSCGVAGCSNGRPPRSRRPAPGSTLRGMYRWMSGGVALAGGAALVVAGFRRGLLAAGRAVPAAVGALARHRATGESAAGLRRRRSALRHRRPIPAPRRAAHLALLRDVHHGRGSRAAAGQLPGRSRARDRPPDIAHEHRALPAVGRRRPRLRMAGHPRRRGSARGDARDHEAPSSAFTATSTTGTTRATSIRWSPNSSPRSTAGISPGT